jgi:hypothetical protein
MDLTLQHDHDLIVVIILYAQAQVSIVAPFLLFFSMKHGLVACGVLPSHFSPKKLVGQKKNRGLTAEPTTQPPVRHSYPGYTLH